MILVIRRRPMTELEEEFNLAVTAGDLAKTRSMLQAGMNPNFETCGMQTPLHCAVDSEIDWTDPNPTSPAISLVPLLLEYGADPNVIDSGGLTPLDITMGNGGSLHQSAADALKRSGGQTGQQLRARPS